MEIIYLLIPLSLALVAVIVGFVIWAVKSGQFEDLDRPAH
ncbi:MAG: cbb3-type cytochrome oxidase assembly protein CcoS, partial [Arenicellales bacterium]